MTNPTPHGQVPEALIDLIDAYAETRHRYGRIYNARTEAARNAVIEALSGVQALSAAPAGWKLVLVEPTVDQEWAGKNAALLCSTMGEACKIYKAMVAASPTPPAEQQAAPKAAPMELNESAYQRGYLDGMAKGRREVEAAPQPAPAPLSFDACDMATAAAQGFRSGQAAAKQEE